MRAGSLGQIVAPSRRLRSSVRMAARMRGLSSVSDASSHHALPRSPRATFASWTRRRAARRAASFAAVPTARRAAISSLTSCWRSDAGIFGSLRRHLRPLISRNASGGGGVTLWARVKSAAILPDGPLNDLIAALGRRGRHASKDDQVCAGSSPRNQASSNRATSGSVRYSSRATPVVTRKLNGGVTSATQAVSARRTPSRSPKPT